MTIMWKKDLSHAQAQLAQNDPILAKLIKRYGMPTFRPHADHYGALVSAIIGQQLSEKAGATIEKRFLALFNGVLPDPDTLLHTDSEKIRAVGVSYGKIGYMKDLAEHILDGRLDLKHIATLPSNLLIQQLTAVKGIGEWTAHMFMIFSLGRLDVLPTGDLGVRKAMMIQYALGELPKPLTMQEVATNHSWHPYESVASWYMWQSLDNK
jgi:DNA-3-methyladenine glycosylase II